MQLCKRLCAFNPRRVRLTSRSLITTTPASGITVMPGNSWQLLDARCPIVLSFSSAQAYWIIGRAGGTKPPKTWLDPRNLQYVTQLALCYQPQRRYQDEERTWDRALTILPGDASTRISRAEVAANWKADMKPYQTTLAKLIAENPSVASDIDDPMFALRERTAEAAARVLKTSPPDGVQWYGVSYPHAYWEGVVARWEGDSTKARSALLWHAPKWKKFSGRSPISPRR
jgi:hypothetical protein